MTPDQRRAFEQQWPQFEKALGRVLAKRNICEADRADVAQETALRLLKRWDRIDHSRPVLPLAITIALNVMRDNLRRSTKREMAMGELPERPCSSDVENEGLTKVQFQDVVRAMKDLSPSHRTVLLDEIAEHPSTSGRSESAVKMLRMRARRRLSALLESASAFVSLAAIKLRIWGPDHSNSVVASSMAAVAFFGVLPSIGGGVSGSSGDALEAPFAAGVARSSDGINRLGFEQEGLAPNHSSRPSDSDGGHRTIPGQRGRPVTIPIGNQGRAEASARVESNDVYIEVRDHGGPVPACVGGLPGTPEELECPED